MTLENFITGMFCCFGEFYNWEVLSLWGVWSFVILGNFMIGLFCLLEDCLL